MRSGIDLAASDIAWNRDSAQFLAAILHQAFVGTTPLKLLHERAGETLDIIECVCRLSKLGKPASIVDLPSLGDQHLVEQATQIIPTLTIGGIACRAHRRRYELTSALTCLCCGHSLRKRAKQSFALAHGNSRWRSYVKEKFIDLASS